MPQTNLQNPSGYDTRWFIWTIVFLVITGISLVSYIILSDDNNQAQAIANLQKIPVHKTVTTKK